MYIGKIENGHLFCCHVFSYDRIQSSLNFWGVPLLIFKQAEELEIFCRENTLDLVLYSDFSEFIGES